MSFLFGNTSKTPASSQKPMGQDLSSASTAEAARPVPYLAGRRRLGLTFISDAFDQRADAVTQSFGKQKTRSGYNYFASFAALACHGPVDALHQIYLNGDPVYAAAAKLTAVSFTRAVLVVTFTTKADHNLVTGDVVLIEGVDQPQYNGLFTITVTGARTFTYTLAAEPDENPSAVNKYITARLQLDPVYRDTEDYVDILIPDFGEMRLYWGTETQTADSYLQTSGTRHPAYRGLCYAVFTQLFIGFNQTSVQNVELVLSRQPQAAWHALAGIEDDANLAAVLGDLIQNPRAGAGLDVDRLDTATLAATGATLADEGIGFSPLLMREQEGRAVLMAFLEYFDAYPTLTDAGRLGIALARTAELAPIELTTADLTSKPSFNPGAWTEARSETNLKFTNRDYSFKEDMVRHRDPGVRSILGEANAQTLDRTFITRPDAARELVEMLGRVAALPPITGRVRLRRTPALWAALQPGALFTFDYALRDTSGLTFRVSEAVWPDPAKPEFEISFKVDRSYLIPEPATGEPEPILGVGGEAITGVGGEPLTF